jgi:hypothetical protein
VLAATVASRLRELGIRAALQAAPHRLPLTIVRQGLFVTLSAIVAGIVVTAPLSSSLRALFFDASAADPRALGGAALLLAVAASAASVVPARRASCRSRSPAEDRLTLHRAHRKHRSGTLVAQSLSKRRMDREIRNRVATWCPWLDHSAVVPCQPGRLRPVAHRRVQF